MEGLIPVAGDRRGRPAGEHTLAFGAPASSWIEALPLGNGRMGAMCFGDPGAHRFQLNEGTGWSGSPLSEQREPLVSRAAAATALANARDAIDRGDNASADVSLRALQHRHSQAFLPFADLTLEVRVGGQQVTASADFSRALHLDEATHYTSCLVDGFAVTSESFISAAAGVLAIRIRSAHPGAFGSRVTLSSPLRVKHAVDEYSRASLVLQLPSDVAPPHDENSVGITYGDAPGEQLTGLVSACWSRTGHAIVDVFVATGTDYRGAGHIPDGDVAGLTRRVETVLRAASARGYDDLRAEHLADHRRLYDRVHLELGLTSPEPADLTERLSRLDPDRPLAADPSLAALQFNYGRYLLLCSSRPGGLPATLQGIWNEHLRPPWSCNYTLNINTQMNYWGAEVAALHECAEPLVALLETVAQGGTETAARIYGAPGWVAHHNTDAWGYTQPVGWGYHDPSWAFWPLAGAWLALAASETVEFGAPWSLSERLWKVMRGCAEFLLSWMRVEPDGSLGTVPSTSPENHFVTAAGEVAASGRSSALDLALIAALFTRFTDLSSMLGHEDPVVIAARDALPRVPAPRIAADGRVAEWPADDAESEPHHRHLSHLYPAYPGSGQLNPDFERAVAASLDGRGGDSTGWSLAWKIALRARLRQASKVDEMLDLFFRTTCSESVSDLGGGIYPNLFTAGPPFQVDANLGYVGALAECLLQSHRGAIELLPALPSTMQTGSVRGLIARPGIEVSMRWQNGVLLEATLRARHVGATGRRRVVLPGGRELAVYLPTNGAVLHLDLPGAP